MPIILEKNGIIATVDGYSIKSDHALSQALLNTLINKRGYSGSDPNPEHTLAIRAIQKFGWSIVKEVEVM